MIRDFKGNEVVWAERALKKQLESFPQTNDVEVEIIVRRGVPYAEILKVGEEERIDLIVIASLGKTGIARYLIGSVARNVLKGSKCPVLLKK
jgi:nucleotide-binding universal stress UspA family protein